MALRVLAPGQLSDRCDQTSAVSEASPSTGPRLLSWAVNSCTCLTPMALYKEFIRAACIRLRLSAPCAVWNNAYGVSDPLLLLSEGGAGKVTSGGPDDLAAFASVPAPVGGCWYCGRTTTDHWCAAACINRYCVSGRCFRQASLLSRLL